MKPIGIIGGGLAGLSAACVLAARGRKVILFERNDWLGGKAAQLTRRRLPLRHGADDPHHPIGAAPHLRRGRRADGGLPRARAARSAVALLLRRRLVARPRAESRRDGADARRLRARHQLRRALPRLHRLQRAARRHLAAPLLLQADRRHAATCSSGRRRSIRRCSATCSRCAWAARSRARCASSRPIRASRR